jgi:Ca2+-binding EF-hand superfamily protein
MDRSDIIEETRQTILSIFRFTDTDKNGTLNKDEIKEMIIKTQGTVPSAEKLQECFSLIDSNKDNRIRSVIKYYCHPKIK